MGLTMENGNQTWPQIFRQLVVANCRYWLNCAQDDVNRLLPETPQVLRSLSYALSLSEAWQWARDLILCFSPLMIRWGQGVTWESFLTKGITRSPEEKDPVEIEFRLQLGNLYRLQGRLSEAQSCFQEALNLCEQYELRTHYWTLINQLGLVTRLSAQHEKALAYCQQVLVEQRAPISERAEALNVMGLVAYDQRQWDDALRYFDQALTLYRSLDDAYQMARILNNRGLVLLRSGNLDEARKSYQEAIRQFRVTNDQAEIFKVIMNLGNVLLMKEEYEAAIQQYQEALPGFEQSNYLIDLANVYNNLGMAYTGLADWQTAEAYFLASLKIARNFSDGYYLANILDNYGKMLMKAKQLKRAYEVLNQALEALNTIPDSPAKTRLQRIIKDRLTQLKDSL
jgi:tetratricopeptide (TPR) repeat protein